MSSFADAALEVLRDRGGGPLHFREITEHAIAGNLIAPKSSTPWTYMRSAIAEDAVRRSRRGEPARFVALGNGYYRVNEVLNEAEAAVGRWNDRTKATLLQRLHDIDPAAFEALIGDLFERAGFEDVEVTQRSKDGGIDVRAVLTVGGLTRVVTAIQVKRWRRAVPIDIVRAMRGALNIEEQGIIVTLSHFTKDAVTEARDPGGRRVSISLLDGKGLVEMLAEHQLGFIRRDIPLLDVDEELFSDAFDRMDEPASAAPERNSNAGRRFLIFRVPGGESRVSAVQRMIDPVVGQTVDDYLSNFRLWFSKVTRTDVAERCLRVLVAFGLVEIAEQRVHLTAEGARYVRCDAEAQEEMLKSAFLLRVYGADSVVAGLRANPRLDLELLAVNLRSAGLEHMTATQLRYQRDWCRALHLL